MKKKKQLDNHYRQCIYCKNIIVKIAIYLFDVNVHILSFVYGACNFSNIWKYYIAFLYLLLIFLQNITRYYRIFYIFLFSSLFYRNEDNYVLIKKKCNIYYVIQ